MFKLGVSGQVLHGAANKIFLTSFTQTKSLSSSVSLYLTTFQWTRYRLSATSQFAANSTGSPKPATKSGSGRTTHSPARSKPPTGPSRATSTLSKPSCISSNTTTSSTPITFKEPAQTSSPPSPSPIANPSTSTSPALPTPPTRSKPSSPTTTC